MLRQVILFSISLLIASLILHRHGDQWEEVVRQSLYSLKGDSIPNYAVEHVDSSGIPWVYYPTQNGIHAGEQYNATIVANYALDYIERFQSDHNPNNVKRFMLCVDWLRNHMQKVDSGALFRYEWQQPWYPSVRYPFTSGMTSGLAVEVFTRAFKLDGDSNHLRSAQLLVNGYRQSLTDGGFTIKEPNGWWYEEIADGTSATPRILDGHIFAISGLWNYYGITHDSTARQCMSKGLQALKHDLPLYDRGIDRPFYDREHKIADKKYQRILIRQMFGLWQITSDPYFLSIYQRWSQPLDRTYIWRIWAEGNRSGMILSFLATGILWMILNILLKFILKTLLS